MSKRQQKPLRVGRILTLEGSPLARITQRANQHEAVERLLRQKLGQPLSNHVALGACEPGRVVLVTDSPVWSSRLRYQARSLLASLSEYFGSQQRTRLEIKVVPELGKEPGRKREGPRLSGAAATHLREFVAAGLEDEHQAEALLRLASSRDDAPHNREDS